MTEISRKDQRARKKRKIRAKVWGTVEKPRLSVFKSSLHIYAQLIDDDLSKTLAAASDLEIKKSQKSKKKKSQIALEVGQKIGQKAKKINIKKVIFDRSGFKYHGRVKALAEGARKAGLIF